MAENKGEFKYSPVKVIVWSTVATLVGLWFSFAFRDTSFGGIGGLVAFVGVVLVITGIVMAAIDHERTQKMIRDAIPLIAAEASSAVTEELERLANLHVTGALSDAEFTAAKAKLIA
jgi:hypothetical protein